MSFLNPLLLFGAAAVAVPIIIHLLNRRRFQRVVWAAMRFVRISAEKNQRRRRMEDMILLALRCLLLLLLALALARPALRDAASRVLGQSKVTAVIVLDHSASMGVSDGAQTRFDKARRAAEQAIDALPAGSAAAVILASDIAREVIKEPTHDLNLARKLVRDAPLSDRPGNLFPALERAAETLHGRAAIRKELYVITDGQATGWRQLGDIQRLLQRARQVPDGQALHAHFLLVGEGEERNLGISGLSLVSGLSPVNRPLRFEARVTNHSRQEAQNIRVTLQVDHESAADESVLTAIPPGETRGVSLFARLSTEGWHAVTARIAEDRFPGDDRRTLAVRGLKETRVLLVDGDPGTEPRDAETFFLGHVLVPVPPAEAEEFFIRPTVITTAELSLTRFDDFDTVILANVPDFAADTAAGLEAFVRRGGGLMVFPGARLNAAFYNEQLARLRPVLPATFGEPRGDAGQDQTFVTLQTQGYDHPIVTLWNDTASGTLASARFFRAFELVPVPEPPAGGTNAAAPGAARVVLRFSNGSPAVVEHTLGLGRVVVFASTADTAWNDLPVRPAVLPLLHRTLGALVQRHDVGANLPVGQPFTRRVNPELLGRDAVVMSPGLTGNTRAVRRIELVNGVPLLLYEATDRSGLYEVSVADPPTVFKFATQPDPAESDLAELSADEFKSLGAVAQVSRWHPTFSLRELVAKQRSGVELWLPLLALVLLIAAVETFLAQWFSRPK